MDVSARHAWRTGDLVHLGPTPDVWELTTFWIGPGGRQMATVEQLVGDRVVVAHAEVDDLRPIG